jgi:hypothetical protein
MSKIIKIFKIRWFFKGLYQIITSHHIIFRLAKYQISQHNNTQRKSFLRKYLEIIYINIRWGELSTTYYAQALDVYEKSLKYDFIPSPIIQQLRDYFNKNYENSLHSINILRDKLQFENFFSSHDICTVQSLCQSNKHSISSFISCLKSHAKSAYINSEFFCKPRFGIKGKGAFKLTLFNDNVFINDTYVQRNNLKFLIKNNFLCQPMLHQHKYLSKLNPSSINTLRFITIKRDTCIDIFCAYLRVGSLSSITDNNKYARAVIPVSLHTGVLHNNGYWITPDSVSITNIHKTSDIYYSDITIPYIFEAINITKKAHALLNLYSIGWDVVITPNGPMLLEGNDNWGFEWAMWVNPDFCEQFFTYFHI